MSEQEVTLGELGRGMDALRGDMATIKTLVEERPDWKDVARVETGLQEKIKVVSDRLARTEGWGNWATKLALGAIGAAIFSGKVFGAG